MSQVKIRDIANEDPSHFEYTFPFIRSPYRATSRVINLIRIWSQQNKVPAARITYRCQHFRHPTEMATGIYAEE